MKLSILVLAQVISLNLSLVTTSYAQTNDLKNEAALFSYGYLEMFTYSEMHFSNAMGWSTKPFYLGIEIATHNSAGRPLHYRRNFQYEWKGVLNKCNIEGNFNYRTPIILNSFELVGDCSFNATGSSPPFHLDYTYSRKITLIPISPSEYDVYIAGESREKRTGTLVEYFRMEHPIRIKISKFRVESIALKGKVDAKYIWGPYSWTFSTKYENETFVLKKPCQRVIGKTPPSTIQYMNSHNSQSYTWVSPIVLDGNGAQITIEGAPYRYDLPKCFPW